MKYVLGHQTSSILVLMLFLLMPNAFVPADGYGARKKPTPSPVHNAPSPSPSHTPTPTPTPSKTPIKATSKSSVLGAATSRPSSMYGIASGLASMSPAELASSLADMKAMGVTWVRYDIEWSNIEYAGPGQYDWGDYDRVVQAVSARGLKSLAIIDYTPQWARRSDCAGTAMCAPADPNVYAGFAGVVANRYKGYGVHAYEVWNEPNSAAFFKPAANAGAYTAMLKVAYGAIKGADPLSTVITGGTAPAGSSNGYLSPVDFVNGMYASGARGYFDALGHHPYTWPYSPAYNNPYNAWGQLSTLHGIMSRNGDGGKKIWMTEFGAPTGGPGGLASSGMTTAEDDFDHVTDALQAKILSDAVSISSGYPWAGPFFWYSYKDAGTSPDTVENFFGLLRPDGSRKPSYYTYRSMITGR